MSSLLIIRHGETEWNREYRIQGNMDVPLSEEGMRQARCTGQRLLGLNITKVYSSDLDRAFQTARLLSEATGRPVETDVALREQDFGEWQGLYFDEVAERYPAELEAYMRDPMNCKVPGGESYGELMQRVSEAAIRIAKANPGLAVAVVSHGGAIKSLVCWLLGLDPKHRSRFRIDNCSLTAVSCEGERWQLISLNDTSHLRPIGPKIIPPEEGNG